MLQLHSFLLYTHILAGALAMVLFVIPMVARKGSLNHRKYGRFYTYTMYVLAISALLMSVMVLVAPNYFKGQLINQSTSPEDTLATVRMFWTLLLFLSLLTFTSIHHANRVLQTKENRAPLRKWHYVAMPVLLMVFASVLFVQGVLMAQHALVSPYLHFIFAVLGIVNGYQILSYIFSQNVARNRWLIEHLSSMCGSGIAVYTAFFAFGARHALAHIGQWQLLFWVMPGVLGGVAIYFYSKKYETLNTRKGV